MQSAERAALIAAHHFGYGEPDPARIGDAQAWVLGQFARPQALAGEGLLGTAEALHLSRDVLRAASRAARAETAAPDVGKMPQVRETRRELRAANVAALQRLWTHVVSTRTPVFERWVAFWANHLSISATKATTAALVFPFEREAIRPHATARFVDMLRASTTHPGMLLYLDNAQSVGPRSRAGRRRERGLNENLARELLELHTLGVNGGYTQADVTETAKLLTGWTLRRGAAGDDDSGVGGGAGAFVAALHEPGDKLILGRRYREGPEALDALLLDLVRRPASADFITGKLVRHFVADPAPEALVRHVAERFRASDGHLGSVAQALFGHELAWSASQPRYKRPDEWILSLHRVLGQALERPEWWWQAATTMGQAVARAPSPQGWSDSEADWLSPDALWKRSEIAAAVAARWGRRIDACSAAAQAHGSDWSEASRRAVERAESPDQALALWLLSPEFVMR